MLIGVPKEIKVHEYRVGITPAGARELTQHGQEVWVEKGAGDGAGFTDKQYQQAGALIKDDVAKIYSSAQLIVKVKEPQEQEYAYLHEGLVLFTYFHFAASKTLTEAMMASGVTCVAYETVKGDDGRLPLLAPMSEVAGRMAVQAGAHALERAQGGRGVLLGGVPGVAPGHVVILGGGVVGSHAAVVAKGMGAQVSILDRSLSRLRVLDEQFHGQVNTIYATQDAIEFYVPTGDLVVGSVLVPGAAAPQLLDRQMLKRMKNGAVLVDVAIDQGGCFATSKPTTHQQPVYEVDNIVHYCVANMPGAVPRTSTVALTNATLPWVLLMAEKGVFEALWANKNLRAGLNIHKGKITCRGVAESFGIPYVDALSVLQK